MRALMKYTLLAWLALAGILPFTAQALEDNLGAQNAGSGRVGGSQNQAPGASLEQLQSAVPRFAETLRGTVPDEFLSGPAQNDVAVLMLERMLGEPVRVVASFFSSNGGAGVLTTGGNSVTVLTNLIALTSYLALIVGSLLILYIVGVGIMNTAYHGQFLGKSWNAMWVPFRPAIAFSLVLPIPGASGLCLVQMIVLTLAMLGFGAGSATWGVAVEELARNPLVTPVPGESIRELPKQMLASMTCMGAAYENSLIDNPGATTTAYTVSPLETGGHFSQSKMRIRFGENGECGQIEYAYPEPGTTLSGVDNIGNFLASGSDNAVREVQQLIARNMGAHINALYRDLLPLARTLAARKHWVVSPEFGSPGIDERAITPAMRNRSADAAVLYFRTASERFVGSLARDAATAIASKREANTEEIKDNLRVGGWALAGSFYWELARRNNDIASALDGNIEFEGSKASANFWRDTEAGPAMATVARDVEGFVNLAAQGGYAGLDAQGGVFYEAEGKFLTGITRSIASLGRDYTSAENPDPMLEIKTLGNTLNNAAVLMAGGSMLMQARGKLSPDGWIGRGLDKLKSSDDPSGFGGTVLSMIAIAIVSAGFVFGNLIPNTPYILWTLSMVGMLVYMVEALVAAPLWAIMHASPEGSETVGRGASGYPIIMALVLRPFLMIVALIAAMTIMRVAGWFINQTVWDAFGTQSESGLNLLGFIGVMAVYAIVMVALVYKSFSLVHELPSAILRWMGGSDHTDIGEGEAMRQTVAIGGFVGGGTREALANTAGASKKPAREPGGGGGDAPTPPAGGRSKNSGIDNQLARASNAQPPSTPSK